MIMKRYFIILFIFAACNHSEAIQDAVYGDVLDVVDPIPVEAVLAEPLHYTGVVAVAGTVHEVCQMDGCWLMLRSMETGDGLRVQSELEAGGTYSFTVPAHISGQYAVVYGTIQPDELEQEDRQVRSMAAVGVRVFPEESR